MSRTTSVEVETTVHTSTDNGETMTRIKHLKIKIMSLAMESRLIRDEANGIKPCYNSDRVETYEGLYHHRIHTVRPAARHALLAYAYLRGVKYRAVETTCRREPKWIVVAKNVAAFSDIPKDDALSNLKEWAKQHSVGSSPSAPCEGNLDCKETATG